MKGFDEALFGRYNAAPWAWDTKGDTNYWNNDKTPEFFTRYKLNGLMEAKKGEKAREVAPLNLEAYTTVEEETFKRSVDFIKRNAESDKPFFIYYASHFVSMFTSHPDWAGKSAPATHSGDQFMEHDHYVGQILRTLGNGNRKLTHRGNPNLTHSLVKKSIPILCLQQEGFRNR